jgi:hypothetical protein
LPEDNQPEDLLSLQHEVDELRHENEELKEEVGAKPSKAKRRLRTISSWVLLVLACILAVTSVMTVFVRNQLLNTDAYLKTVAPLASNPAIQTQIAKKVSTNLIANTDVQQRIKNALPPKAGFLAAPIASGMSTVVDRATLKIVQSSQFETVWVAANRAAHKQLVNVLTGQQQGSVSSSNGRVTIDLSQVEVRAKQALDQRGITIFDKVPAVKGLNYVLFESKDLAKIQRLIKLLNKVAVVLPIITLLLFAAAVILARNRRRGLVRAAVGLAVSMAFILVALAVARNHYLSSLNPSQSVAANSAVIAIVTNSLRAAVRIILIIAAVVALIGVIAGIPALRRWVGGHQRPAFLVDSPFVRFVAAHRKGLQWTVLVIGLAVLVLWNNPTSLVAVIVVIIALIFVAVVGLIGGNPGAAPAIENGAPALSTSGSSGGRDDGTV